MTKISYNDKNPKDKEMVEDYYFYKYYVESVKFDWGTIELSAKNLKIIKKHLNQSELERAVKIHRKTYCKNLKSIVDWRRFLLDIFGNNNHIKILKHNLIRKFKNI